ncbi:helix-turn-helix domain-containing protein [Dethiobacter alkaliphilus]|uniref:Putative transcriptional regulator, XRE family n=1 Tax=Dethiobacter alkaliphilus AHT 1 TaxID=555088 RepID=C0GE83_DETAL|nr:helix-turn-helix transcriptional regulator [Dethiobacter alkaliphilus]EEG78377.1 putative transcriptional regulator, XRE family [Dethiobacter alkaliphilus AHT 1]
MIVFTLDRVMFERSRMKVPELQQLSSVNKNTLYGIYNNTSKRVDLDVLNRICSALDCEPGDLMKYIPDDGQLKLF